MSMISKACERVREAHAAVGRYADSVWAARCDSDPYKLANQELWIRECRVQEQFKTFSSPTNYDKSTHAVRTVNDTIPGSRFARIYAVGRQYEPEREACYKPSYEVGHELTTAHPVNIGPPYENLECWQLPEVEMYFRELTKGHPEQDLFFSALVDSSVSEIAVEEQNKVINMRDNEWITQTPWRTILSERYPPMRDYLDKSDSQRNNSYLSSISLLDIATYPIPQYLITSLQELALQMKIQSAEVRAIWNDNSILVTKSTKRQRRTPRLPMEPSVVLSNKRFNNPDINEFYSNNFDSNQGNSGYSFFQNCSILSENLRSNTQRHADYDDPKFNVFNEIDARKKFFFNKNTEIVDPPLFNNNNNDQKTSQIGDKKVNAVSKNHSFASKKSNQSTQLSNSDKTFKILHSPQNIDSKVLNYVRNVPTTVLQGYPPSSIQGIEFNPVFTVENRPNVEEKFSRAPGAGRKFVKKRATKQSVETVTKPDQKADKLLEALTKISQQSVDNIDDETMNNKVESESTISRTFVRQETTQNDTDNTKMYILSKNENFTLNSKTNFTKYKTTQFTKSDSNFDATEPNMSNFIEKKFNLFTQLDDNTDSNISFSKKTRIGSVDVPEFIPRFLVKEPAANLKISLSLPNISETTDIPEFYPKDYTNVPKKAASVYDKPLKIVKTKLPENTNSISSDDPNKFSSDENSIPVYQRPREFHKTTGNINNNRQRKQQGVDYNNLIFLTSDGNDPKKWLNKEYPNRLNELNKVDNLINSFSNLHNNYTIENQQKSKQIASSSSGGPVMPIDNNKFVQKLDLHSYQQNITNPVIYHQNPITRQYPIQNLSPVALPNVINVVPGGILVSTCSQMPILSHNIYVNQNIIPIPPNTITPRSLGVQGINQAYQSLPSTSLVPPAVPCAQNVSQSIGHGYQASLPPIVSHAMRVSPRNVLSKVQQPCHSKMNICPHAIKNTIYQGAKRRLYSAVLSNTNTTMDSDCDELEREALEQYRPSEESLKDSSDDSIQAKYQELERLAMEQYTTSSSSASSESCALGNGSILVSETGPPGIRTAMNSESNTGIIGQNIKNMMPQIKSAIVRKSNSNLSMGSKLSSTMMLPSIGEVSNDEADSPKNNISPRGLEDNSSKRRIIVVKSTSRQVSSDHSSDAEENDEYGPQIVITSFGQKKKEEFSSTISTDRSEIEFKLSLLASVENLHESTPGPKSEYYIEDCKEYLETKCLHGEKLLLEQSNIISNSKKEIGENSSVKSTNSNLPPCTLITREVKSAGHNKRRQGRKAKKVI